MQFLYHKNAGIARLELEGGDFTHIIRARRHKLNDIIRLRHLRDDMLFVYRISAIEKSRLYLDLLESLLLPSQARYVLHLLYAMIDVKHIEKILPLLNELGVAKISFFYAQFSQHHFRLDFTRMQHILIQSCQQCGRTRLMEIEMCGDFDDICQKYAPFAVFDFNGLDISLESAIAVSDIDSNPTSLWRVMLGAEGGFSPKERDCLDLMCKQGKANILSLNNGLILQSHTASVFLASIAHTKIKKEQKCNTYTQQKTI